MKIKNHQKQMKYKLELYEKAENCVKTLHDIDEKIGDYLAGQRTTISTTKTVNTLSKWHSECTKFIENLDGFTYEFSEISKLLETVIDPVLLVNKYIDDISAKVYDSIFKPTMTVSGDFFTIGTLCTYIMENKDKHQHQLSCIHKMAELYLKVDRDKFKIDWNIFFSTWKRLCEIEISILETYMSNATIDDIYDKHKPYYGEWTELWTIAGVSCQSNDTEDHFYTGDIFNIDDNPYIFTGVLKTTHWGEDGTEDIYHAIFRCDDIDDEKIIFIEKTIKDPDHPFFVGENTDTIVVKLNTNIGEAYQ